MYAGNFSFGGRHELKGGYQWSRIGNKVDLGQNDQITLRSGTTGLATVGAYSGRNIPSTPGAIGSGKQIVFNIDAESPGRNFLFRREGRSLDK